MVRTPLSPNQITLLSAGIGLFAASCFLWADYWLSLLGAVLLQVSIVLDCCDGEVARVRFEESRFGDWLDIACDTLVHIAIFVGIGFGVWQAHETSHAVELGVALVLGGMLAFPLVTLAEKTALRQVKSCRERARKFASILLPSVVRMDSG